MQAEDFYFYLYFLNDCDFENEKFLRALLPAFRGQNQNIFEY